MAIELFCEVHGCELDTYILNKKVTVTPCSKCENDARDSAYIEGCDWRDDEVDSLAEERDRLSVLLKEAESSLREELKKSPL